MEGISSALHPYCCIVWSSVKLLLVLRVLTQDCKFFYLCVSQAIVMVLESNGEKTFKMVLQLLKSLSVSSIITVDQMRRVWCHLVSELCTTLCFFGGGFFVVKGFSFSCRAIKEFTWTSLKLTSMSLVHTLSWSSLLTRASAWESLM